jgi:hypothetical protein
MEVSAHSPSPTLKSRRLIAKLPLAVLLGAGLRQLHGHDDVAHLALDA